VNLEQFQRRLADYQATFSALADRYDGTISRSSKLESVIDEYSAFVTNDDHRQVWTELERQPSRENVELIAELRKSSALCVAMMEKYRALKLLNGESERCDYFHNIEACIEQEFGSFQVTGDSKVLLVGSGSFPMTPLFIARQTGAAVVGIDIDEEAVALGRKVVERLGGGLRITLVNEAVERLEGIEDTTHIIFSSTVSEKYQLLDRLHERTCDRVVVAMRYGDRLKSLFNYPLQAVDERKWRLADQVLRPDRVFDIALYQKA
jgi:hypothetical protein